MKSHNKNSISKLAESQARLQTETKLNSELNQSLKKIVVQQNQGQNRTEQKKEQCFLMAPVNFFSNFFQIYRFGGCQDKVLMVFGIILALCAGVTFPLFMYFWGKQIDHTVFDFFFLRDTLDKSLQYYLAFIGLGVGSFLIDGVVFALWKILSERIGYLFRVKYMESFVQRRTDWIERQNLYETSSKFKLNCLIIEKATGDKVALFYILNGVTISGAISAICVRWTFSLFLLALVPIGMAVLGYFIYVLIMRKLDAKRFFESAEGQSVEAVSLIKTVKMLQGEKQQESTYTHRLDEYQESIKAYPLKLGISTGLFYFIQYFIFGVGFMFGIQCVRGTSACPIDTTGSHYSVGDLHIAFFQTYICTYYFLQLASNFDAIKDAIQSSKEIFQFIKETQQQNDKMQAEISIRKINQDDYQKPSEIGDVELRDVQFFYPTNPNKKIFRQLSLKPLKNKFNAIVGVTGSGKSTITQLLLKFYGPSKGNVLIGGRNINDINADWLRERIGFVGQQPTLFSGTLKENIALGKSNVTDEEIWEILRQVNMYEFVMKLPQKLDYDIGIGGQKLSGGQKQRIAIARALIKKPSLLILDEATSALDRKSQKLIQKTLESIFLSKDLNMTVICIAHKVKTIVKADRIFYLENGCIKEQGTFKEISCFKDIQLPPQQDEKGIHFEQQFIRPQANAIQEVKEVKDQEEYRGNTYTKLLERSENKGWYALSIFASLLNGLSHPAAILILSYMYKQEIDMIQYGFKWGWCAAGSPSDCYSVLDNYHNNAVKYLGGLIGFAFYAFFPYLVQINLMTKIEQEITHNLRKQVFTKLMLMPVTWYERPQNEGGIVASRCAVDAKEASTLVTSYIPVLVVNFTTIITGIAICLGYLWKVGLLSLFSVPLIAIGGYISMFFIGGYQDQTLKKYQASEKLGSELIICIKTVLSLNYQEKMVKKYISLIQNSSSESFKRGAKIGFFFGFSVFMIMTSIGTAMFSQDHILAYLQQAKTIEIVVALTVPIWCGWVAGNNFFFASHASAGKKSAERIFKLLQERTEAQEQQIKAVKIITPPPNEIRGRIEFKGVSFKYPNGKQVLRDINLVIQAGQKAAFVGQSGCGKSTLVLLLQRFYDFEGEITLDGVSIRDYGLATYRSYFSVLNQEPTLFTGTIRENIHFGNNSSEAEFIEACKMTFAYDVNRMWKGNVSIEENVEEFVNRDTGVKGSKVSGGEKQRIACARAVLRKPKIFLMDEGTSALDRQTEKRVQKNIDEKLKGITTVNIAHRLETIENSDVIFMVQDGKIVERGKYTEMIERKAHFQKFIQGQKFKTINQIQELMLMKLVAKLLGLNKKK